MLLATCFKSCVNSNNGNPTIPGVAQQIGGSLTTPNNVILNPHRGEPFAFLNDDDAASLGIELNEAAVKKFPVKDKVLDTPLGFDGSVQDR